MQIIIEESSGLGVGAVVQIAGLPSGNVVALDFDTATDKVIVTLKVDRKYAPKITEGSRASIRTQGALGDKFVMIKPGPGQAPVLKEGDTIPAEENTDLLSTLGKSGLQVEKAFDILNRINVMTKQLEEGGFGKNVADASKSFKSSMSSVEDALASRKLNRALDHLANILEKIDKGQGTLGGIINDPTIHEDLKSILGGAKRNNLLKYLIRQTIQKSEDEQEKGKKK
jgi:phospholipid/cholesterol/gamma-HCH transport system substrate-binding protein